MTDELRVLLTPGPNANGPVGLPGQDPIPPEGKTVRRSELEPYLPLILQKRLTALPVAE